MSIIYKTTNLINNKIYIGQSNNKNKNYIGSGRIFLKAVKKYGKNNFIKEILIEGDLTTEELDNLEIKYISEYNSTNKEIGYNIRSGGNGNTEKQNRLIGLFNQNKKLSETTKQKISDSKKNKLASEETKQKMSEQKLGNQLRKGIKHSEEDRINISKGIKKYFESDESHIIASKVAIDRYQKGLLNGNYKIFSEQKFKQKEITELARLINIKTIQVLNTENNEIIIFESLAECRKYFGIKGNNSLINSAKSGKLYRKIYSISYINI